MISAQESAPTAYSRHTHHSHLQHQKLVDSKAENSGVQRFDRHSGSGGGLKPVAKKSGNGTGNWGRYERLCLEIGCTSG